MGRERSRSVSRGIRVRQYISGKESIEIQFNYLGVTCKEILKNLSPTKANCRYAINLKAEIENAITKGFFNYAKYFLTQTDSNFLAFLLIGLWTSELEFCPLLQRAALN